MLKLTMSVLAAALLITQASPVFTLGMSPGEGIPHFFAAAPSITLHSSPSTAGPALARVDLPLGTEIRYSETRYQTREPGLLRARSEATISGRNFERRTQLSRDDYYRLRLVRGEATVAAGDTIEYLQYRAEGTCFVRIRGDIWDTDACPRLREDRFTVLSEPVVEWWVRTDPPTVPTGWLLVTDSTLTMRRSF